jgi:hypothetical protein
LESDSNVTDLRVLQKAKQELPIVATELGMQIEESDRHGEKADVGSSVMRELESNATARR